MQQIETFATFMGFLSKMVRVLIVVYGVVALCIWGLMAAGLLLYGADAFTDGWVTWHWPLGLDSSAGTMPLLVAMAFTAGLALLYAALWFLTLLPFEKLMEEYAAGRVFSADAIASIQKFGTWCVLFSLVPEIDGTTVHLELDMLPAALFILLIGRVMVVGRELQLEQELTV